MADSLKLFTFIIFLGLISSNSSMHTEHNGFCTTVNCNSLAKLKNLENCTVVVGDLKILLLEKAKPNDFANITFPKLKEVTGFMVVYRVAGLETFGRMFPNLARIRGNNLLYNYALIVYDVPDLREVGFYSLLKIDRGGVIIWGGPLTCYVNTIDWSRIAPKSRHVLSSPDKHAACNMMCTCSRNSMTNRCWNNKKCQRFLDGPDGERCSDECLGCRRTNAKSCALCREFTSGDGCVSHCPNKTLVLSESNYCVTTTECEILNRFSWEGRCVVDCPENYVKSRHNKTVTCTRCDDCKKICGNLTLQTLASIQDAQKCVFVNGSLTIRVWSIPSVENELRFYLKNIVEVSDYILIYGSMTLTSLHFLSSLKRVRGKRLYGKRYSLVVHDMHNLQALFLSNVTENLSVGNGTLRLYRNPMLCKKQIEKLKTLFDTPNELDIPQGLNGYSGSCEEVSLGLKISATNETTAIATFYSAAKAESNYTILYVRMPHGVNATIVPETCSEFEWSAISVNVTTETSVKVELTNLQPASTYIACIETYELYSRFLARSSVVNFSTPVGKPEPPFIFELTASFSNAVVIRWVNHLDYKPFIDRHELDVKIIDRTVDVDVIHKGNCLYPDTNTVEIDYTRHAKVMRPPRQYEKSCESMCGVLSTVTVGAMVEEYFDVCSDIYNCSDSEYIERPINRTEGGILKSISLNLNGSTNIFQVSGLASFRDYRFELRACTKELCSRTVREFVRTLRARHADEAIVKSSSANALGYVTVEWEPPKSTNGPILCYNLEIYPGIKINDVSRTLPQVKSVASNVTKLVVKSMKAKKYVVRICTTTLGSNYLCSESMKIDVVEDAKQNTLGTWVTGIVIGVLIYFSSLLVGWKYRHREVRSDDIPLVDATSEYRNESEPPAVMLSDFAPLYHETCM